MISLFNETGTFTFSGYGSKSAILFIGDDAFLDRCYCLVNNTPYPTCKLHVYDASSKYAILSKERFMDILRWTFGAEVRLSSRGQSDESIAVQAEEMVNRFWSTKIIMSNELRKPKEGWTDDDFQTAERTSKGNNLKSFIRHSPYF